MKGQPCLFIATPPLPSRQEFDTLVARFKSTDCAVWSGYAKYGWMFPASYEAILSIQTKVIDACPEYRWLLHTECIALLHAAYRAQEARDTDPENLKPIPVKTMPEFLHQRRGYHLIITQPTLYLDWEMGTGKTFPVIAALNSMASLRRVLILCPPSVTHVWGAEFVKHTPAPLWTVATTGKRSPVTTGPRGTVLVANAGNVGKRVERANTVERQMTALNRQFILVLNYQAAWRDRMKEYLLCGDPKAKSVSWDLCVCDEAHWIKAPGGVTSQFMKRLRGQCKRRLCLSGTPMPHSPADIYGQARFLDPAIFGESFNRFKHKYPFDGAVALDLDTDGGITVTGDYSFTRRCMDLKVSGRRWRENRWWFPHHYASIMGLLGAFADVPIMMSEEFIAACVNVGTTAHLNMTTVNRAAMEREFQDKLRRFMDKVVSEDVLDLPPIVNEFRTVDLGPTAARVYRDLEKHLIAEVGDGTLTAANALARIVRLQQVTSGCVPVTRKATFDETVEMVLVDDAKEQALAEILGDLPPTEPVVVFCRFVTDLEAVGTVAKAAGRDVAYIRGGRNDIGARWESDPDTEAGRATVAVVQIQAGGLGIDLTRARYAIFYSLSYSLGEFLQASKRIHRQGQKRSAVILHVVARGTIDETIYEALATKKQVVDHVLGVLRKPRL